MVNMGAVIDITDRLTQELFSETEVGNLNSGTYRSRNTNEPDYRNYTSILKKHWKPIQRKLKEFSTQYLGFEPDFSRLKIRVGKLPTYYSGRTGKPDGKVFGSYNPVKDEMIIDSSVLDEFEDSERPLLQKYGILTQDADDVMTHEGTHALQRRSGGIVNYIARTGKRARDYIEGVATKVTERLTGKRQKVYPREQRLATKTIDNYGLARAFRGQVAAVPFFDEIGSSQPTLALLVYMPMTRYPDLKIAA